MAEVRLDKIQKAYGPVQVLRDVDLHIRDGEFMVFVGPSGCGKSTLLRTIAGLEDITGGELRIGGRLVNDVPPAERGIAMVFQSYALYPHMNLYENMAFGLELAKVPKAEIDSAVRHAARVLHIEHLLERKPKDLSGGQRQRVAIGRAIVRKPEVFLFDEPLSNLDAALRGRMRVEFAKLHQDLKTTMVYVTHDQVEAMTLADRIAVLQAGRIEQVGTPLELYEHPDNLFVAGFIGSPRMNFMAAKVVEASARSARVRLADGSTWVCEVDAARLRPGETVTLGIRPEHFEAGRPAAGHAAGDNAMAATVSFVETLGSSTQAYLPKPGAAAVAAGEEPDDPLVCHLDGRLRPRQGEPLELKAAPMACYLFDAEGRALRRLAAPEHLPAALAT